MRKTLIVLSLLASASLAVAQTGPKFSTSGGVASSTSTFNGGELTGGTYSVNGTTGTVSTPIINLRPGAAPASPQNGDCWTTTAGFFCRINGATVGPYGVATGTVSSVGIAPPSIFTAGSPVTSSGNLSFSLNSQTAATVFAAPIASTGTPAFRALVGSDIPAVNLAGSGNGGVTGALPIANGGTGSTTAANARTALGLGTMAIQNAATVAITGGAIAGITDLAVADGGTGSSTAAGARTNLGATTVGGNLFTLTNPSAVTFPRFNADNSVSALDAASFRTAIGVGTGTGTVVSVDASGGTTGLSFAGGPVTSTGTLTLGGTLAATNGGTGVSSAAAATVFAGPVGSTGAPTFRALVGSDIPTLNQNTTGTASNVTGTVALANGGTGATTAVNARTNLGLGTMAVQNAATVAITGGAIAGITDLAVADGGTGSSTAAGARTNLGLGTAAIQNTGASGANVPLLNGTNTWSGDQTLNSRLAVSQGGTATEARMDMVADSGQYARYRYYTGSTAAAGLRWVMGKTNVAESGANVGSDFRLDRFDDTGVSLGVALGVNRATGAVSFGTPLGITSGGTGSATATGASDNIQFTPGGTGSLARSITAKFKEMRSVTDYAGCDPTGVTDSTTCFTNAMASFGVGGGVLKVVGKFLLSSAITIPVGVSLTGECKMPGTPGNNTAAPYGNYTCGVLMVNSAGTINMSSGSNLSSLIIYRAGMSFPPPNSGAFAGTAVTAAGEDVSLTAVQIMGFNKAFYSTGYQRARIEYLYADNNNGIEIANALDVPYISHSHFWPFSNIGVGGAYTNITRSGKAIYLHDTVDWARISDVFSYGYNRGIVLENVNSTSIVAAGADNAFSGVPLNTGSIGLEILGNSSDTNVMGFQAAAQEVAGIHINTTGATMLTNPVIWGGSSHSILIDSGDTTITGGILGGLTPVSNGISVASTTARVGISGVKFGTVAGNPINVSAVNSNLKIGNNDYGAYTGVVTGPNFTSKTIASADPLPVLPGFDNYLVTGTTSFGNIKAGITGQTITLVFQSTLSVFNSVGAATSIKLLGGATYTPGLNSTLTLRYVNGQWYEIGRS